MSTAALNHFKIAEVDGLEVISLVDNSADFLSTTDKKCRLESNVHYS
jgi:hypothetical protein